MIFISNIHASDLYSGKKNKDRGNIDLVNAMDNGIASYIVANNGIDAVNSNVTDDVNFYTCDISSIKSTILGNPEKNGTFAYIIHSNEIRVGIGTDADDCSRYGDDGGTPCKVLKHVLEYINNTYSHLKKGLNITPKFIKIVGTESDVQEGLENDEIDVYISEIILNDIILNKGLLIGCSYSIGTEIDQEEQEIKTKAFLFRRDYDTNSEGERVFFGNDFLVDAFNAGFVDWKMNDPVGVDSETGNQRRSYKKLIQDVFGFWDERYQNLVIAKSTYPSLTLTTDSTAFRNMLFGHYIIAWMPNFKNRDYDCYIGEHSTVGLEKTVLKEVFYKISEHYGRRIEIMYYRGEDNLNISTYEQIKQFQTNSDLGGVSVFIDTLIPYAEYYKYVQFGGEFFTNTITPVFSGRKYCYSDESNLSLYPCSSSLGNELKDVKNSSLTDLIASAGKICMDIGERSIIKNLVYGFIDRNEYEFIGATKSNIIGSMMENLREGTCDLLLADFGTVQSYFFNKTINNEEGDLENIFQVTSTGVCNGDNDKEECDEKLLTDFSYQFQFAPAFKRDKDNSNVSTISDNESKIMSIASYVTAGFGLGLAIASIFVSRGVVTRCISRRREEKQERGASNVMRSTNLIVEPTLISSKVGNNNIGPIIENDW